MAVLKGVIDGVFVLQFAQKGALFLGDVCASTLAFVLAY